MKAHDRSSREHNEKAWQEVIDEAVARGLLIPIGLSSEGKMLYRRTSEKRPEKKLAQEGLNKRN